MFITAETSITIEAPGDAVWDYASQPANWTASNPWAIPRVRVFEDGVADDPARTSGAGAASGSEIGRLEDYATYPAAGPRAGLDVDQLRTPAKADHRASVPT